MKQKKLRNLIQINIILVIFSMMLFACENSLTVIKEITQVDTLADMSARDIVFIRSDSGIIYMRLEAPLMLRFVGDDPKIEFPEGFEATFFDSLQQPSSRISANYGVSHEISQLMLAKSDVEVENFKTGELLNTETLFWNQKSKQIYTKAFVKISAPDKIIYGDSLSATDNFSTRTIYNIRATVEIDEKDDF